MRMLRNKLLIASLCPHVMVAADKQADIKSETVVGQRLSLEWRFL